MAQTLPLKIKTVRFKLFRCFDLLGANVLMYASTLQPYENWYEQIAVVQFLLKAGMDPDVTDKNGLYFINYITNP